MPFVSESPINFLHHWCSYFVYLFFFFCSPLAALCVCWHSESAKNENAFSNNVPYIIILPFYTINILHWKTFAQHQHILHRFHGTSTSIHIDGFQFNIKYALVIYVVVINFKLCTFSRCLQSIWNVRV